MVYKYVLKRMVLSPLFFPKFAPKLNRIGSRKNIYRRASDYQA
jgi:hypothetical protein